MTRDEGKQNQVLVTLGLLVLLSPAFMMGQATPINTPDDSPLWWPLVDGMTIADFRAAYTPEAIARYYRDAVAAGHAPDCGSDYVPTAYSDDRTVERIPMWFAVKRFLQASTTMPSRIRGERVGPLDKPDLARHHQVLESHGLSSDSLTTISTHFSALWTDIVDLHDRSWFAGERMYGAIQRYMVESGLASLEHLEKLGPGSAAARRLVAEDPDLAARRGELEKLRNALESRDDLYLHLTIGGDRGQWQEWLRLTDADAELPVIARMMTALRFDLGESDWTAFRRYLLSASTVPDLDFSFSMSPACDPEIMNEWDRQRIQQIQRTGFTRERRQ